MKTKIISVKKVKRFMYYGKGPWWVFVWLWKKTMGPSLGDILAIGMAMGDPLLNYYSWLKEEGYSCPELESRLGVQRQGFPYVR